MKIKLLGGVLAAGVAVATLTAMTPGPVTLHRTASQSTGINQSNTTGGTWDLRGAVWDHNSPDPIAYPIRSEAWTKGWVLGGKVLGNIPRAWTRDQWYNGQDGGENMSGEGVRLTMTDTAENYAVVKNTRVTDVEDAFDPNAVRPGHTTHLRHVYAANIRDDAVENDDVPHNMVIRNSLFNGVFTGFSQRPGGSHSQQNGEGPHRFVVRHSLMWIKPMPLGPDYASDSSVQRGRALPTTRDNVWLGAYGIWKWSPEAASRVVVKNSIFRLDIGSYSSCSSQEWPDGTYENVTLVWTGEGPYREAGDCTNVLPPGVTVTRDLNVWKQARYAWLHGQPWVSPR